MKSIFKSFYQPQDTELKQLWENAVFIFDTNVLTNLYRYQSSTRESLLTVMEQLNNRVWIPHHVALEYQRNRLNVVGEQHKKFNETKKIVEHAVNDLQKKLEQLQLKKRHSHINPDTLVNGINGLAQEFFQDLDNLESDSIRVGSTDQLRDRLDNLFEGKVGTAPSQNDILNIEKEGEQRFSKQIPPGYKDSNKAKDTDDGYIFNGVEYHRQYGDLIVWKQILEYVKSSEIKYLIFITDDSKDDWWQKSQGKTISLRHELIDEIFRETDIESFYAYKSETFLTHAKQYVDKNVPDDTLEEIKLVSESQSMETKIKLHDDDDSYMNEVNHNPYKSFSESIRKRNEMIDSYPESLRRVVDIINSYPESIRKAVEVTNDYPERLIKAFKDNE